MTLIVRINARKFKPFLEKRKTEISSMHSLIWFPQVTKNYSKNIHCICGVLDKKKEKKTNKHGFVQMDKEVLK